MPIKELALIFLNNPFIIIIGWIGGIASLISIPLSIYLSSSAPHLSYSIPHQFTLIQYLNDDKLKIYHEDIADEIKENISKVNIKIWNSGRKEIRYEDIREPLLITSRSNIKILKASIFDDQKKYFDTEIDNDLVKIAFNILEPNEGNTVQILYIGDSSATFQLEGKIVGQKTLSRWNFLSHSLDQSLTYFVISLLIFLYLSFIVRIVLFILNITLFKVIPSSRKVINFERKIVLLADVSVYFLVLLLSFFIFWIWQATHWGPPF